MGQKFCFVAKKYGFKPTTIPSRIRRGWGVEQALTAPLQDKEEV